MKLIINCDDLGASPEINDRIFELMEQRRVTSATLMMNAPATEDALRRIGKYPHCSIGIHLNGTEFTPLTSHPGLAPLLEESGEFSRALRRISLTKEIRASIFAEWSAQIERAQAAGLHFTHIDSHQFVHTLPGLFGVLKRIQKKFHIRKVRLTSNVFGPDERKNLRLRTAKFAWNFALRHYYSTITTDGMAAFLALYQRLRAGLIYEGVLEVMCHPGRVKFDAETELLRGDWRAMLANDDRLISYHEL